MLEVKLHTNLMTIFTYDVAEDWQLGFQEAASPIMEEIINFHNYVMIYLTFILIGTSYILFETLNTYSKSNKLISHKKEITWKQLNLVKRVHIWNDCLLNIGKKTVFEGLNFGGFANCQFYSK